MCGDLLLKFLKLYQKFRVLTERLNTPAAELNIPKIDAFFFGYKKLCNPL